MEPVVKTEQIDPPGRVIKSEPVDDSAAALAYSKLPPRASSVFPRINAPAMSRAPELRAFDVDTLFSLQRRLQSEKNPKVWEMHVNKVLPILQDVQRVFDLIISSPTVYPEVKAAAVGWSKHIQAIRECTSRINEITIGIFGSTGDGKSSTINALLGEGSLLPTNCRKACTACVTELSYNHDEDEDSSYRAEIDFLSPQEWRQEVQLFLAELSSGNDRCEDEDDALVSDASKAIAKTRAVYANMDEEELRQSNADQLVNHPVVRDKLGKTKSFKASTAEDLRDLIECFIDSNHETDDDGGAIWPVVKVVRIYTKAEALSNGVTMVDLPGLQDADAARASMAHEYMDKCAGLWIVAPISRAVDNKTATDLMGESFTRQLKLDGSFSAVTFICTKTDGIPLEEAMKDFGKHLDNDTKKAWAELRSCNQQIKKMERENKLVKKKKRTTSDELADEEPPAKKAKTDKLEILKERKQELNAQVRYNCIKMRNDLSRDFLTTYFSRVVKEAEKKVAMALSDEESGVVIPFLESRRLPVFCTSSHVYQEMKDLSSGDADVCSGFEDLEDTEIPQLQHHAQQLTEELRVAKQREVLGGISQLLNSVAIWTQAQGGNSASVDPAMLQLYISQLEDDILGLAEDCYHKIGQRQRLFYNRMNNLLSHADSEADEIAGAWWIPKANGGIPHGTLKATFLRNGVWKGRDFNEELLKAYTSHIVNDWNVFFNVQLPARYDNLSKAVTEKILKNHEEITKGLGGGNAEATGVAGKLLQQAKQHTDTVNSLIARAKDIVQKAQKVANRAPLRTVARKMRPGYQECAAEKGKGSFGRMKTIILDHVAENRDEMYSRAGKEVKKIMQLALDEVNEILRAGLSDIVSASKTDYNLALAAREESARREEVALKGVMMDVLASAEPLFK
ncbi:Nuclear GTPase SLIP-GC [Colletotrichum spinosum]|uniref:Nuclear GTPase SLIP-GC n=1 Tax=Colletotrichum spinosum TaxID=1347390 RepID=A0A4R8PU72_9PEZI|nr:Nuclear GTPase SLIP-GC [Colletotrichum spinosum]